MRRVPQNITVLQGENGTFTCDGSTTLAVVWKVEKEGHDPKCLQTRVALLFKEKLTELREQGVFLSLVMLGNKYVSTMTITGTVDNNITRVSCALEAPEIGQLNYSRAAFLRVIGKYLHGMQCNRE